VAREARPHLDRKQEGNLLGAGRGSKDLQRVLADCFGCRSRRAAPGPSGNAKGLAPRPWKGNLPGARGANGRRKPARGGEVVRTVAGSRKRALVDGRRSGPTKSSSLTRRRRKRIWLLAGIEPRPDRSGARQRASEVESRARLAVDNTVAGRHRLEGLPIAAPARTDRCHHHARLEASPPRTFAARVATTTEAGGSPSSEAPPRRLAPLEAARSREERSATRESNHP